MVRVVAALVFLALLAAGCGARAAKTFTAAGTAPCLKEQGFKGVTQAPAKIGLIAALAANGGLQANTADSSNTVRIAFASDDADVASTQAAVKNQAPPFYKKRINDIMRVDGNAVMVWTTSPSQDQLDAVEGCLGS